MNSDIDKSDKANGSQLDSTGESNEGTAGKIDSTGERDKDNGSQPDMTNKSDKDIGSQLDSTGESDKDTAGKIDSMGESNEGTSSQLDLIMEYFEAHPNKDIKHPEVVDWVTAKWKERTGKVFRDPDRGIRMLHQKGYLKKIGKGIYRYDPDDVKLRDDLEDFSPELKKQILERDGYQCVICGMGRKNDVEVQVDHIIPKDLGGKATLENGQTLCVRHNFMKKNLGQIESGKKMFIRMLETAKQKSDKELISFLEDVLEVYEKHNINGHIVWKK